MTFIEVDKILQKDGWQLKKVRGSHYMYTNPNKPECGKITVPYHGKNKELNPKTANALFKQAGL